MPVKPLGVLCIPVCGVVVAVGFCGFENTHWKVPNRCGAVPIVVIAFFGECVCGFGNLMVALFFCLCCLMDL